MQIIFRQCTVHLWPAVILIFAAVAAISWYKRRSLVHLTLLALFGVYLYAVLNIALFPIRAYTVALYDLERFMQGVNLVPFRFDLSFIPHIVVRQIIQNILLTVPFGFGLNVVVRVRPRDFVWIIPVSGASLEATQLLISLLVGYPYRVIDINDVMLNTLGVVLGHTLFMAGRWLVTTVSTTADPARTTD